MKRSCQKSGLSVCLWVALQEFLLHELFNLLCMTALRQCEISHVSIFESHIHRTLYPRLVGFGGMSWIIAEQPLKLFSLCCVKVHENMMNLVQMIKADIIPRNSHLVVIEMEWMQQRFETIARKTTNYFQTFKDEIIRKIVKVRRQCLEIYGNHLCQWRLAAPFLWGDTVCHSSAAHINWF